MADGSARESLSLSQLQRQSFVRRKSSVKKDAKEFKERRTTGEWEDSSTVSSCRRCEKKFSLTKRKHHCRECGKVYCSKCSAFQVVVNGALKRACFACYENTIHKDPNLFMGSNTKLNAMPAVYSGMKGDSSQELPGNAAVDLQQGSVVTSNIKNQLPKWIDAILFVRTHESKDAEGFKNQTLKLKRLHPENSLPDGLVNDVFLNAILNVPKNTRVAFEEKFMFRVRDKTLPGSVFRDEAKNAEIGTAVSVATTFYNCYCHYQYYEGLSSSAELSPNKATSIPTVYQQAVVIVSRWPFPNLAYRLLEQIDEAFLWQTQEMRLSDESNDTDAAEWKEFSPEEDNLQPLDVASNEPKRASLYGTRQSSVRGSFDISRRPSLMSTLQQHSIGSVGVELDEEVVTNVLVVALSQVTLWPAPTPGVIVYLHSFGDILHHVIESDVSTVFGANLSFSPYLSTVNLVALFGPLGLLQHIWTLWELLVTGQDIVVVAPTAAQCTEIVLGLTSLLVPTGSVGDFRPYVNANDSDLLVIAATAQLKAGDVESTGLEENVSRVMSRNRSMIVGVTDPNALTVLEDFTAALFIYPQTEEGYLSDSDASFKGLRTKNTAEFVIIDDSDVQKKTKSMIYKAKKRSTNDSFKHAFQSWLEKGSRKTTLVSRKETSTVILKRLLLRLKRLHPDDRLVLGDQLLRDHLQSLTKAYFAPTGSSQPLGSKIDIVKEKSEFEAETRRLTQMKSAEEKGMFYLGLEEFKIWVRSIPTWIANNLSLVIMWSAIMSFYWILYVLGTPVFFLVLIAFLMKIPERVPPQLEQYLLVILPKRAESSTNASLAASHLDRKNQVELHSCEDIEARPRSNLSGVWKRVKLDNYENFLAVQGASYVQRKLAASITMVHTITMDDALAVFRLQEKGGPIDTDTTYVMGGPEVETAVQKNTFVDKADWKGDRLVITKLRTPEKGYELQISRWLTSGGKSLMMEAIYKELKEGGKKVVSNIQYDYQGPSPNTPPQSAASFDSKQATACIDTKEKVVRKDFSGVWQRTKTHNFEAFIGATGAGFMQRKLAAQMALTHTITMDAELRAFRLQEKGGPINLDNTFTIGADFQPTTLSGKKFVQRLYWLDAMLVLQRRAEDGSFEMILTRSLEDENVDAPHIVLKSLHRDLASSREVEATSWFSKTGPSPNAPPSPDLSLLVTETANVEEGLSSFPNAEDLDNDEDEDDVAVAKMRTISGAHKSSMKRAFSSAGDVSKLLSQALTSKGFADMSGDWAQQPGKTVEGVIGWSYHRARTRYSIRMDSENFHCVETNNKTVIEDAKLVIGNEDFITVANKRRKAIKARCYWEGNALVVLRLYNKPKCEIFIKRELIDDGKSMRVTTVRKELPSGTQSEFLAVFHKIV